MRITIIGAGYVGLVTAVCFACGGHQVICLEKDEARCRMLSEGQCPILERKLPEMLNQAFTDRKISFTTQPQEAIPHGEIVFIAVGTPSRAGGQADLSALFEVAAEIGKYIHDGSIIVIKSTVPPKTTGLFRRIILDSVPDGKSDIQVLCNPEFLREGSAVDDFLFPDRIVVGSDNPKAGELLFDLYRSLFHQSVPEILTSPINAELIKYASNSYLAVRLSFVNELAGLCESLGGSISQVTGGMGLDHRIGSEYLTAGIGYGGACLPKDTRALVQIAKRAGTPLTVLESAITANRMVAIRLAKRVAKRISQGEIVAIWGLSFKAGTEDIRDSPVLSLMKELSETLNCSFQIYDPAGCEFAMGYPKEIQRVLCPAPEVAVSEASALIVGTAWPQFGEINLFTLSVAMKKRTIFDFVNALDGEKARQAGFEYYACGEGWPD